MNDTIEVTRISEALAFIDGRLVQMQQRDIVPSEEVADMLLDLRSLLILASAETAPN